MRILVLSAVMIAWCGCKARPRATDPEPSRNPYHDVMPEKVKQKVEDTQKKEDERNDKVLENAK